MTCCEWVIKLGCVLDDCNSKDMLVDQGDSDVDSYIGLACIDYDCGYSWVILKWAVIHVSLRMRQMGYGRVDGTPHIVD